MAKQTIKVNEDLCIGCGACVETADQYFKINEETGKSEAIKDYDQADDEIIQKAIDKCPVSAISLENEKTEE